MTGVDMQQIETLRKIFGALDQALGDTDPFLDPDMTDEEVRDEEPLFWAAQKLSAEIQRLEKLHSARDGKYFIQCAESWSGNSALWWRPNGHGYTTNLNEAGQYDAADAHSIERIRGIDKAWPVDLVMQHAAPHLSQADLAKLEEALPK